MSVELEGQVRAKQVRLRPLSSPATATGHAQCLVVSASQTRRELLADAASRARWDATVCADEHNALAALRRTKYRLAFVDLQYYGKTPAGFRELCCRFAEASDILLVICGHPCDPQEEIWARQLGVWLYLPGLAEVSVQDVVGLYDQAHLVCRTLEKTAR